MKKLLLFFFICCCCLLPVKRTMAQNPDLTVTLQESVLNKMFKAMGDIKGTESYSFMFVEGTYDWALVNPQFKIHPGRVDFVTDVKVTISQYTYTMHVTGNAEVCYEPTTNLIYIEITDASFPLNMMILGKERHLWDVDLARYFETPFTFDGPLTVGTEFIFPMPDNTTKTIYMHPVNCGVKIAEKQIIVSAEMEFVNRDAQKIPAAIPKK